MGKVKVCTVSPSLLVSLPPIPKDRKPPNYLVWDNLGSLIHGNMMIIEKMMTSFACSGTTGTGNVNRCDRAPHGPMSQEK